MKHIDPIQIIATLGPATTDPAVIEALLRAGTSLVRLNFSHGTREEHQTFVDSARQAAGRLGRRVAIVQDLSGPRTPTDGGHSFDAQAPVVTHKDITDVQSLVSREVEYIAQSFVRTADDVEDLRSVLHAEGLSTKIIAKIERPEALRNLDDIIAAADGIMIARGDLGNAVPLEKLPFIKKDILARCRLSLTPCIVATELLTSMQDDPVPSRADISDIAQAVVDGASATMLSNETAVGANPVEAVAMMRRVVDEARTHTTTGSAARFHV